MKVVKKEFFSLNRNDSELIKIGLNKTRPKSYGASEIVTEHDSLTTAIWQSLYHPRFQT